MADLQAEVQAAAGLAAVTRFDRLIAETEEHQ
jgi:GTP cyclohydrolase III